MCSFFTMRGVVLMVKVVHSTEGLMPHMEVDGGIVVEIWLGLMFMNGMFASRGRKMEVWQSYLDILIINYGDH